MCHSSLSHWAPWSHHSFTSDFLPLTVTTCLLKALTLHLSPKPIWLLLAVFHLPTIHFSLLVMPGRSTSHQPHCLGIPFGIPWPLCSRKHLILLSLPWSPTLMTYFLSVSLPLECRERPWKTGCSAKCYQPSASGKMGLEEWLNSEQPDQGVGEWYPLPWCGHSQLPDWQGSTRKWENNEISLDFSDTHVC